MNTRSLLALGLLTSAAILPSSRAIAADGKTIFANNCASCHGSAGQGTPGLAPALKGDRFVTGGLQAVLETVTNGRAGDQKKFKDLPVAMPAWSNSLSAGDIKAVVDYIRGDLQK
jgi:cytochrome c oxidase cbb3-type subunit III